ncbi:MULTISPECIES: enoyl-CoA hydratase/isomerase family protein [Olivibacter]|jgi:methylglutaconyl-CoA hydratase|uniref:Enoyl-CoA hydratase/isomerase family protein n=2 Tax=Olivibacter TaxID=376469 RepID=A0ABV6HKC9_9SPHI|nr:MULTISPECIES: enoyl-CoA hydratase/isomerase family protein [Olivibacter]MCL4638957.1 enoyl-CoA hydratase/isomerase family protein [Olivibacter sp. UJ_SKK_5.1]MDM8175371.1 enoyl-CoA hydratase/isomerase family protein [Olivibacter sp. 47]MDX3913986.1 enoyl-CoA hydratase/isomerase family protein [Pseudosphingobacterium sp.]QEL02133.1 enoyl-CoA hydratase/isomerase family protein [Olivibacter sp. LS-1]
MSKLKSESGTITSVINGKIATISFYHPNHNALPSSLLNQLAQSIDKFGKNESIHVIVLKSEGEKTFCAGANFDELLTIKSEEEGKLFFSGFAKVINAIRLARQPVIGRIQGKAIGGAVGLAAACDYCFATKDASVKLSELSIGIGPFVIAPAVQRKVGLSAFTELAFNPLSFKSAYWAAERGLYQSVLDDIEALDSTVENFCKQLADYSFIALCEIKKYLWNETKHWDSLLLSQAEISGKLIVDTQTKEAINKIKFDNKAR